MAAAGAVALNPAPARTGSGAPGIGPIPACALDLAGRDDRLVRGVGRARVANLKGLRRRPVRWRPAGQPHQHK